MFTGSDYNLTFDPLFAPVDVAQSTYEVKSTKIEIKLKKRTPGQKWSTLEGVTGPGREKDAATPVDGASRASMNTSATNTVAQAPSYPTSSKTGPKDWDKLADELTKKRTKKESNEHKNTEGAAGGEDQAVAEEETDDFDDDDEGDPVNGFFKKLYKGADPDTQRAMMKSYQESNGTALSTNWAEVGKGKVETSPPEGMVAKKWDE